MIPTLLQILAIVVQLIAVGIVLRHLDRTKLRSVSIVAVTVLIGLSLPQMVSVLRKLGSTTPTTTSFPELFAYLANALLLLGGAFLFRVRESAQQQASSATIATPATPGENAPFCDRAKLAPIGIFLTNPSGHLIFANEKFRRSTGRTAGDLSGEVWIDAVHPDDRGRVFQHWAEAVREKRSFQHECRFQRPDGLSVWVDCSAVPRLSSSGEIIEYHGSVVDITARVKTETALRLERGLFIGGPTVIFRWLAQDGWPVAYVSPNVRSQFGYNPEDLTSGRIPYASIVHPDDLARVAEEVRQFSEAGVACAEQEYRLANAHGSYRWVYDFTVIERDERGVITSYLGYLLDVTERRQVEETLRQTLQSYADVIASIPSGLCIFQFEPPDRLTLVESNAAAEELAGFNLNTLRGKQFEEIWHSARESGMIDSIMSVVQTGETYHEESLAYADDHIEGTFRIRAFRMPNQRLGFAFDNVTELKRAERLLLESERRFRLLFNDAPIAYQSLDEAGCILQVNDAWLSSLGYSSSDVLGKTYREFLAPASIARFQESYDRLRSAGRIDGIELDMVRKDGTTLLVSLNGKMAVNESSSVRQAHCVFRDITALRQGEQALRESEARYRQIFEGNCAIKLLIDPNDGSIVDANSAATEFYGYDHDQLTSMKINQINTLPAEEVAEHLNDVRTAKNLVFQFPHRRADGTLVDVEVHSSPISVGGRVLLYSIIHDISDRCRAERQKAHLEEQLRRSQKLETIGTLAAGIAHDFNNLLVPVIGYSEMIQADSPEDSPASRHINEVLRASYRARDLVAQILSFSRQQGGERKIVQLQSLVKEVTAAVRGEWPDHILITEQIDDLTPPILADPVQILQVLRHLVGNAMEAMPGGGAVSLVLGSNPPDGRRWPSNHHQRSPGREIYLTIEDTGAGMDRVTLDRIFDPFFTTKDVGRGSGLGLSVAHGIITEHGGQIAVQSELGVGSTFCITLPIADFIPEVWAGSTQSEHAGTDGNLRETASVDSLDT